MIEAQFFNQNLKSMISKMANFTENISLDRDGRKYSITHKSLEKNNTEKRIATEAEKQRVYSPSLMSIH